MISVEEIKKNEKIKNKKKKECYLKILELINNKIIIISKTNQKYIWFEIPLFMIGYPTYDINHLYQYLDSLEDICCLTLGTDSKYLPHDRAWIKEHIFSQLKGQAS